VAARRIGHGSHRTALRGLLTHGQIDEPFSSLLSTTRAVLFSPQRFFDELPPDGPLGPPVLYFLICSTITAVINVVATLTFLAVPVGISLAINSLDTGLLFRALAIFVPE
jgi:hypothetical protein